MEPLTTARRLGAWGIAMLLVAGVGLSGAASAASVTPTVIPGASNTDKTCAVVMPGTLEYKIEPVPDGTYTMGDGTLSVTVTKPSTLAGSLNSIDFTANRFVVGVIVKDGVDGANFYNYGVGGTKSDTYLTTPNNGDKGISHVSFCYYKELPPDAILDVRKTAAGSYDIPITWTLEKTVDPASHSGFAGQSFNSTWTVVATKETGAPTNIKVVGDIVITNPNSVDAAITVTDALNDGTDATVTCLTDTVPANGEVTCTYVASPTDDTATLNTASVAVADLTGSPFTFTENVTFIANETGATSGTLSDERSGYSEEISESTTETFEETFTCSDDASKYANGTYSFIETNTATLNGNIGLEASATVTVTCYAPVVSKDAQTSLKRKYTWDIEKSANYGNQEEPVDNRLILAFGQTSPPVDYTVSVSATIEEGSDSDWAVNGTISVYNPANEPMTVVVSDTVSDGIGATVDCGEGSTELTVGAGQTETCTYTANLPNADARINTATATLNGIHATLNGIGFTGTAAVDFTNAEVTFVDRCVEVTDTNSADGTIVPSDAFGAEGIEICAEGGSVEYSLTFGPYTAEDCTETGIIERLNTASFETNDTETTGSASWTVAIVLPCDNGGCTLTPGYWKTHSIKGPAPYDDNWAKIGEDTLFFLSGQSYYTVLWTAPSGNAYYILAHAYIAAQLNELNGADFTDAQTAFDAATVLFETYTPAQVAALRGNSPVRQQFISLAETLDRYNNGLTGPGKCSE